MEEEFKACYEFIRSDIRLCAVVNKKDGKQELVMQKLKSSGTPKKKAAVEFSESLECIHTAVLDISPEDLEHAVSDPDFGEKTLKIRSSENLVEFDLAPEEKFKAFKSWVAGIAEAGLDAFRIQSEIEGEGRLIYPIAHPLMRFLAKIDTKIMFEYIEMIERTCIHEGVRHKASLIANLDPILEILVQNPNMESYDKILEAIFQIDPPLQLFTEDQNKLKFLSHPDALNLSEFIEVPSEAPPVRFAVLDNPKIAESEIIDHFLSYGTEPVYYIRRKGATLIDSPDNEEFRNFLSFKTEPDYRVRKAAAANTKTTKFQQTIKNFFNYKTEPHPSVRKVIAAREDCAKFEEYKNFLSYKTEPDPDVRKTAARNRKSLKKPEYKNFLNFKTEPNFEVRTIAALNRAASNIKEFQNLTSKDHEPNERVRQLARQTRTEIEESHPITRKDYELYDRLTSELAELTEEFYGDVSELRKHIKKLNERLFPPEVQLEEDVSRELERLKRMAVKRKHELPKKRF